MGKEEKVIIAYERTIKCNQKYFSNFFPLPRKAQVLQHMKSVHLIHHLFWMRGSEKFESVVTNTTISLKYLGTVKAQTLVLFIFRVLQNLLLRLKFDGYSACSQMIQNTIERVCISFLCLSVSQKEGNSEPFIR